MWKAQAFKDGDFSGPHLGPLLGSEEADKTASVPASQLLGLYAGPCLPLVASDLVLIFE